MHDILGNSKNHHAAKHHDRPVHVDRCGVVDSREEDKDDGEAQPRQGEDIDRQAQLAEREAGPGDATRLESNADESGDGQDVGAEESGDADGRDGVEGSRGADVDQTQQNGYDCGHQHGDDWDVGALVDVGQGARERECVVASEGKGLAGGSGEDTDGTADFHDDDDGCDAVGGGL